MKINATVNDLWERAQLEVRREQSRGVRNPLKNSSFFLTNAGYYIEQAMLGVEERRGMVAEYAGKHEKFYDADNPDALLCSIDRNSFWNHVLDLVLDSRSLARFENSYSDYLWELISY